jgi:hypothetical protein
MLVFLFTGLCSQEVYSQMGFSHELGLIAGPVAFYSDYGVENDFETNSNNVGFGIGLIHYMNFAFSADCNCYTRGKYFNDHFKLRSEIDYHKTNLEHIGKWIGPDKTSITADQLRAMHGSTTVFEIGSQLEFFPMSIRDFTAGASRLAPFISFGIHWVSYDPKVVSDLGDLNTPETTPEKYFNAFQQEPGNTWSVLTSIGVRFKLSRSSDLMLDSRWQYYFSNWVDGLNPGFDNNGSVEVPENNANDWIYWLNLGYILYL